MIETLVRIYLGMVVAQFLWSLIVYTKVGRDENMKKAYTEGAQDAYKEQFGMPYDWSDSELNRYLSIMYYVAIIRECVIQGLEWPLEVLWTIKTTIKESLTALFFFFFRKICNPYNETNMEVTIMSNMVNGVIKKTNNIIKTTKEGINMEGTRKRVGNATQKMLKKIRKSENKMQRDYNKFKHEHPTTYACDIWAGAVMTTLVLPQSIPAYIGGAIFMGVEGLPMMHSVRKTVIRKLTKKRA